MPHFLCFTDLNNPNSSAKEKNPSAAIAADSSTQNIDTSAPATEVAGESSQHPTSLFVREENKKSSFGLHQPFALFYESGHNLQNGDNVPKSAQVSADGYVNADEVHDQAIGDHQNCDKSDARPVEGAPAIGREKETMVATASITSCISDESPRFIPQARETFLFGGFELITNVKTVEVYVTKTSNPEEESYLTTCKGIPLRDLPPLMKTPLYIDGTRDEGESTTIENHDGQSCNIKESKETKDALGGGATKTEERDIFYKFVFVSPGGPKPVERIRLKFVRSNASCVHANSIIVRTLKVKGRLSDSIPTSNASQQSMPQPPLPIGTANFNPGIRNNERKDDMSSLASMMAMMGGNSMMGMPMAMQMSPQQQQLKQLQTQPSHQQYAQHQQQQQQNNHQQEKNQAEIVSSVAGLGIFLRSSEERTMNKLETMLTNMEMRIMKRLDGLAERLDVIEQSVNESNHELGSR
mmetsp:Transcript_21158/g.38305  ORF Transcript_21158/g.38305 Transcript_21158/m.38305 type:complete len:468 (+) Transcript_21158:111-1514(+)